MDGKTLKDGSKVPYSSLKESVKVTYAEGGIKNFYKGFSSMCHRVMSWNVIMFVIREQLLEQLTKNEK